MANTWFRMYSEFADDPKVQMMQEHMQRRLIMLLCQRCKCETLQKQEMMFHWRVTETQLDETKALFIEKGFIDQDWNVLNWNKRQFISDSSTERVRRHRESMKQSETLQKQDVTAHVTAPDTEQIQNRTEKEQKKYSLADAEDIYREYPRRVGKEAALKAITKALKRLSADYDDPKGFLIERVRAHKAHVESNGTEPQFVKHPQGWFNAGSYMDEHLSPKPKKTYEIITWDEVRKERELAAL